MKTRISVRSRRNVSVIESSQELVRERRAGDDGQDAAENRGGHVERGAAVVAIGEQRDAFVAERAHRRKGAAEADRETGSEIGAEQGRPGRIAEQAAEKGT